MAKNPDIPAQPRDPDRSDSLDDRVRDDVESVRGIGESDDDEFEDTEEIESDEEEGTF